MSTPRHSEVVPSFVVPLVKRRLPTWVGDVAPHELLRWERPGDLTTTVRGELRAEIIKRLRSKTQDLWQVPVGVRTLEGWASRLLPSEQKSIEALVAGGRALHQFTLRELKDALHVPLERMLSILARIEATYWNASAVPPSTRTANAPGGSAFPVPVDDALRALAEDVCALSWLPSVSPEDLRFGYPGGTPLPEWIAMQVSQLVVSPLLAPMLSGLLAADRLTAETECKELAVLAAQHCSNRPNAEREARWAEIMVARHVSASGPGRTLQDVGDSFGVTRERIRQVCEEMEQVLAKGPVAMPALDRVFRAASRIVPCSIEEANEQLARFIGTGAGMEAMFAWSEALQRKPPQIRCGQVRMMLHGQQMDVRMLEHVDAADWVGPALRHASRDCSVVGCSSIIRVAGQLALKEGLVPGQDALESALAESTGFRWLDRDCGWFSLANSSSSAAATRVRKIMAVAHHAVGADQIAAAFASDDVWLYREERRAFAIPPPHVLRELFLGWDFLRVVQKGRFVPRAQLDVEGVLSPSERIAVSVMEAQGGVACRFELKEAIMSALGLTDMAVAAMLGSSPVVVKMEHGLYALLGRRVGDAAFDAARRRLRAKGSSPFLQQSWLAANEFLLRVSDASLRNEQYSIPARFRQALGSRPLAAHDLEGEPLGTARANSSGVLSGLNRLLPAIKVGDCILVRVVGDAVWLGLKVGLAVELEPAPQEDATEQGEPDVFVYPAQWAAPGP